MDVRQIARLARLDLGDDELDRIARELRHVLAHVEQLRELDLSAVPDPLPLPTPLRDDAVTPSLPPADVAANAPAFAHGHFVVPRVLGEE